MDLVVTSIQAVAKDVVAIQLQLENGDALPKFTAGAHLDVVLPDGMVRQYSIFNSPLDEDRYCIGVHRSPTSRGGSIQMHGLKVGDKIIVSEPRNNFALVPDCQNAILIAGGIGITPILSMATHLYETGTNFRFYYSARASDTMAFRQLIESAPWRDHATLHFSDIAKSHLNLPEILANPRPDTHVYVCGPGAMIDAVLATASAQGWCTSHVHRERFGAEVVHVGTDKEFVVELAKSGMQVTVQKNQSIATALRKQGVVIQTSCEQGICGTCLTGLKSGLADHRDDYLTEEEKRDGKQIMICCSRAISEKLVLDL